MPAALDLTGRRFGRLRVLNADGRVKYGRDQAAWRVSCNCGHQETLAQDQITKKGWRECSLCRRPACVICGAKIPTIRPRSATCSSTCQTVKQRSDWRAAYHHRSADPRFNQQRHQRLIDRMNSDTELADRIRAIRRTAGARWRSDPANREAIRQYHAARYAANREQILAARRTRLDSMTADQLQHWKSRMRAYHRTYARRYREEMRSDPHRHRAFLDRMREYRRRQQQ